MALGVGVLIGGILAAIGKLLSVEVVKFLAFRALIYTGLVLVLPAVLYNLYSLVIGEVLDYVGAHVGESGLQGVVIQLTGIGAWMGGLLKIPESVSFLLSCSLCRFVISMVRGV